MHSEREHACPPPSRPLNHRSTGALCPLPLCCCSGEETEGRREEREEEEETYDSGPRCTVNFLFYLISIFRQPYLSNHKSNSSEPLI
ncbi:Os11g0147150 [Oryza sativa Japonica Group]|uniref:Os11g0147150 protein n=1 Tax=Oryza sativa subsp. japonica TaxID=39947 RepID=C7J8U2_ORYSJ|nr:Os11g0147150 [Oryza sativa Japonica Group]|eukprot:NP_001176350.1 Os11g0147150 [Oryza sativa Japonica Group]